MVGIQILIELSVFLGFGVYHRIRSIVCGVYSESDSKRRILGYHSTDYRGKSIDSDLDLTTK